MKVQVNFEIEHEIKLIIEHLAEKGEITLKQFINNAILNYIPFYERGLKKTQQIKEKYLTTNEIVDLMYEH